MNGGELCIGARLSGVWQRVEAELNRRRLGATLATAGLYENVRIMLLLCVCILSIGVCKSRVVDAIVRI